MVYIKNQISKNISILIISIGLIFLVTALILIIYDTYKDKKANIKSDIILKQLEEKILSNDIKDNNIINIDNEEYLGIINIPVLNLSLPVYSDYSLKKLDSAPAVYSGSINTNNLVICAHNYKSHFGYLNKIKINDLIVIIDSNNKKHVYEVSEIVITKPLAIEEMINSDYDLTLFTCTTSGASRLTIRCKKIN